MKKIKKLAGIFLVFVLSLQCINGVVFKAKAAANLVYVEDSVKLSVADKNGNHDGTKVEMTVENKGDTSIGAFKVDVSYKYTNPVPHHWDGVYDTANLSMSSFIDQAVAAGEKKDISFIARVGDYVAGQGAPYNGTRELQSVSITPYEVKAPESSIAALEIQNVDVVNNQVKVTIKNTEKYKKYTNVECVVTYLESKNNEKNIKSAGLTSQEIGGESTVVLESQWLEGLTTPLFGVSITSAKEEDVDVTVNRDAKDMYAPASEKLSGFITWSVFNYGSYRDKRDKTGKTYQGLSWRVVGNGPGYTELMCNEVIDATPYSNSLAYEEWSDSAMKEFLNGSGFWDNVQGIDKSNLVTNEELEADVWIPSSAEIATPGYGMQAISSGTVKANQLKATDSAKSQLDASSYDKEGYCNYFLRDKGKVQSYGTPPNVVQKCVDNAAVLKSGVLSTGGIRSYSKKAGIVPVIRIKDTSVLTGYRSESKPITKVTTKKKKKNLKESVSGQLASVGTKKKLNRVTFQVTKSTKKARTVAVTSVTKNAKNVTIPKNIKINNNTYKVTAIKGNAFKRAKNTLKTVNIKSKNINNISKNAFDGLNKKAVIKVPSSKFKKYLKWIQKGNQELSVKKLK